MGSLLLGCKVILPIIVFMGLGYLFRNLKMASIKTFQELNKIAFRSFLPVMIFFNIYKSDLKADFSLQVLIYAIVAVFATFFTSMVLINIRFRGSENRSVLIQGMYRSNFVLFGMSVTQSICGADKMGMASILVAIVVPIFNVLAVILFETYGSKRKSKIAVLKGIAKNPLIIASVLGIIVKLSGLTFPSFATDILGSISAVATPLALVCLGGTFVFSRVGQYKRELVWACLGRLVIVSLVFISIAVALGYRDANLVALMVMLASPAAVSSYTMACEMGGNGELAGMIVVFTSVLSIITIFLWVFALSSLGLIAG